MRSKSVLLVLLIFFPVVIFAQDESTENPEVAAVPTMGAPIELSGTFTGDVRTLPYEPPNKESARPELEGPELPTHKMKLKGAKEPPRVPEAPVPPNMPTPSQSFKGLDFATWGNGWPPDTVGDVGPVHFIQAVNTSIGIYNKTGTQLAAFSFNTLWNGTSTPCDNNNNGDPTVIYDSIADRWIVSDFAWTDTANGPYYECVAVSMTNNPVSGGWWLYAIRADDAAHPWLSDYPKMGVWPDGIYMTANMFDCANAACNPGPFQGVRVWAFNRDDLYSGVPVRQIIVDIPAASNRFALLPSHYKSGTLPPTGRENFLAAESFTAFAFEVYKFHVNWVTPASSTFTGPTNVSQTSYIVSPATATTPANSVDTLLDRLMMQNQYRNIAGVESLWVAHTSGRATGSPALASVQWAQINISGGTIITTPVQQQIFNNVLDGLHRFMPSIAADRAGNVMVGYSVSNTTTNPDIRVAGRLATDPLNNLSQGETTVLSGVTRSTQSGNCGGGVCSRWGDYSAMNIDPIDGCTFWYTDEYYESLGLNWQTRIAALRYTTGQCASRAPGEPGTLLLSKSGGNLVFTWTGVAAACDHADYAVYKGTLTSLPTFNHTSLSCTTSNTTTLTVPMPSDSAAYFLITSESPFDEGSYGKTSAGAERPASSSACRLAQSVGTCS